MWNGTQVWFHLRVSLQSNCNFEEGMLSFFSIKIIIATIFEFDGSKRLALEKNCAMGVSDSPKAGEGNGCVK